MTDFTAALARLTTDVQNETTVDQSVLTLVTSMAGEIRSLSSQVGTGDVTPADAAAQLAALADTMESNAGGLTAAVTANTPAAPTPATPATPGTTAPPEPAAPIGDTATGPSESAGAPPEPAPAPDTGEPTADSSAPAAGGPDTATGS